MQDGRKAHKQRDMKGSRGKMEGKTDWQEETRKEEKGLTDKERGRGNGRNKGRGKGRKKGSRK